MLKPGTRVTRMAQKVGQHPPEGEIVHVTRDSYEIRWDDGHTSFITTEGIIPVKKPKAS